MQIAAPNRELLSVLIEWNGDQSFSLACREASDEKLHAMIRAIRKVLQTAPLPRITDIITTFHSINIVFDPPKQGCIPDKNNPATNFFQSITIPGSYFLHPLFLRIQV